MNITNSIIKTILLSLIILPPLCVIQFVILAVFALFLPFIVLENLINSEDQPYIIDGIFTPLNMYLGTLTKLWSIPIINNTDEN